MIKKICVLVQNIISKHNKTRDHKMNLLMITDGKGIWHYIAIKIISASLKGVS